VREEIGVVGRDGASWPMRWRGTTFVYPATATGSAGSMAADTGDPDDSDPSETSSVATTWKNG
jgi:hypothetical protein